MKAALIGSALPIPSLDTHVLSKPLSFQTWKKLVRPAVLRRVPRRVSRSRSHAHSNTDWLSRTCPKFTECSKLTTRQSTFGSPDQPYSLRSVNGRHLIFGRTEQLSVIPSCNSFELNSTRQEHMLSTSTLWRSTCQGHSTMQSSQRKLWFRITLNLPRLSRFKELRDRQRISKLKRRKMCRSSRVKHRRKPRRSMNRPRESLRSKTFRAWTSSSSWLKRTCLRAEAKIKRIASWNSTLWTEFLPSVTQRTTSYSSTLAEMLPLLSTDRIKVFRFTKKIFSISIPVFSNLLFIITYL